MNIWKKKTCLTILALLLTLVLDGCLLRTSGAAGKGEQWQGVFIGDGFSMEITEFTGEGFSFEIRNQSENSSAMDGTAEIDQDNNYIADLLYGKVRFVLSKDYSQIEFFAQGTEWAKLSGRYRRVE